MRKREKCEWFSEATLLKRGKGNFVFLSYAFCLCFRGSIWSQPDQTNGIIRSIGRWAEISQCKPIPSRDRSGVGFQLSTLKHQNTPTHQNTLKRKENAVRCSPRRRFVPNADGTAWGSVESDASFATGRVVALCFLFHWVSALATPPGPITMQHHKL